MKMIYRMRQFLPLIAFLSAALLPAQTQPSQESDSPDKAMMAPVTALASYMAHVHGTVMPPVFVDDGLIIIENFAPYIFRGKNAAGDWDVGYRHHAEKRLKDLKFEFGSAHDFGRNEKRAYFVLPTTWRGIDEDGHFEEHGAWSFVLDEKLPGQWRIAAYGWGATIETDWPLATGGDAVSATDAVDKKAVAALDTEYQAAVKKNDAATMGRLLADDFILVLGDGKTYTKADSVNEARSGRVVYEHQEDTEQTVRVWGDTAVITAKLLYKGTYSGKPFDSADWFSDTYVRTPSGWRYVFGQASLPVTTGNAKQ
jgi:ketosteroid isomerase-like protein